MDIPKPKPPVVVEKPKTVEPKKKPFVPKPHLTHQPFRNRGLNDLKINLKNR